MLLSGLPKLPYFQSNSRGKRKQEAAGPVEEVWIEVPGPEPLPHDIIIDEEIVGEEDIIEVVEEDDDVIWVEIVPSAESPKQVPQEDIIEEEVWD